MLRFVLGTLSMSTTIRLRWDWCWCRFRQFCFCFGNQERTLRGLHFAVFGRYTCESTVLDGRHGSAFCRSDRVRVTTTVYIVFGDRDSCVCGCACVASNLEATKRLVRFHGIVLNVKNNLNKTPEDVATDHKHEKVVAEVRQRGQYVQMCVTNFTAFFCGLCSQSQIKNASAILSLWPQSPMGM